MPRPAIALFAALCIGAPPGLAGAAEPPPTAHAVLFLDAYTIGLRVMRMRTELDLTTAGYAVQAVYHTTGLAGMLASTRQVASVVGFWRPAGVAPRLFRSDGQWGGRSTQVAIDFSGAVPTLRALVPANDRDHDPIPPAATVGTEDTLSPMAQLIRQVAQTGRCDGSAATYDGRRVADISVRTVGMEVLPATGRSSFSGLALRCDFTGWQVAGFAHGAGPAAHRPKYGSAWFARLSPGGPPLPVRLRFETPWVGSVTMYAAAPPQPG